MQDSGGANPTPDAGVATTARPRFPVFWIVVASICGLAVVPCVGAWWFLEKKWEEMVIRTARAQQRFEACTGERPVLWGEARPGCAFEACREALALTKQIDEEFEKLEDGNPRSEAYSSIWHNWAERKPLTAYSDATWQTVERLEPAFVLVRKGALCREGKRPIGWKSGTVEVGIDIRSFQVLGIHAQLSIWRSLAEGRHVEGIHLLLDLLQLGFDRFADPVTVHRFIGATSIQNSLELFIACWGPSLGNSSATEPPVPRVSLEKLSPEARALLRTGLARLAKRTVPSLADTMLVEAILTRWAAELPGTMEAGSRPLSESLVGRVMISDAVDRMFHWAGKLQEVGNDWQALRPLLDECDAAVREASVFWRMSRRIGNVLFQTATTRLSEIDKVERRVWTKIRAMLMALAEIDGDEDPLVLSDPYGGVIRHRVVGDRTYYWSVGPDGIDQQGDPEKDVVFVR